MNFVKLVKNPKPYFQEAIRKSTNLWHTYFNTGELVHCEICEWDGARFYNGKCPKCNSLPRTRLVPFSLRHFGLVKKNLTILHIAPNRNEYNYVKNNFEHIKQYDRLNIRPVPHINLVQDITNTNLINGSYDLVIVWHVLEHIVEDRKAAAEIYRILKPGGSLLMSVPIYPIGSPKTYEDSSIKYENYEKIHGHDDHCRSCGLDYYKRFEEVGFKTKTLNNYTLKDLDKFGLSKNHVVWCFNS
ncbi:class I SAM-dependent methyltransferase [Rasiella sp. SM2506]|uniref:class I SAM-dependent methyltransferase n=1 Tax=Rasiella sp. SM2506 TaxID=3423914 RepID=UPI003D792CB3